jgi:hypothetical protein
MIYLFYRTDAYSKLSTKGWRFHKAVESSSKAHSAMLNFEMLIEQNLSWTCIDEEQIRTASLVLPDSAEDELTASANDDLGSICD